MKFSRKWNQGLALWALSVVAATISSVSPASALDPDACDGAVWVEPGTIARGFGQDEPEVLAVDVPSRGLVMVHATVPISDSVEPKLVFLGRDCTGKMGGETAIVARYVAGVVLNVQGAGTYYFLMGSQDPRQPLGAYKVISRFQSDEDRMSILHKGTPQEEPEPDPDTLQGTPQEEPEPDPDTFGLCGQGEADDHGDSFTCATVLSAGSTVTGQSQNGWADDEDVFSFTIATQRTVRVEIGGDADAIAALYDGYGHRLAGGGDASSTLVKTLGAGHYFVRVAGRHGAEGSYTITFDTLDR